MKLENIDFFKDIFSSVKSGGGGMSQQEIK